jgi:hypothetical protein
MSDEENMNIEKQNNFYHQGTKVTKYGKKGEYFL